MKFILNAGLAAMFALAHASAMSETVSVPCSKAEYVKFGLSEGGTPRHVLFASVPCEYISNLTAEQSASLDVYRFRAEEKPGSNAIQKLDYVGESSAIGSRALAVGLTKEMAEQLAAGKLLLDNAPKSSRYAMIVLRKGKTAAEVLELAKDEIKLQEYMKGHLVMYAFPENAGSIK